jgi:preprotein translocase subunit SecD
MQAEFDKLDCTKPFPSTQRPEDIAAQPLITCDRNQQAKYILAPVVVPGSDVTTAAANFTSPQNGIGQWVVDLAFNGNGTRKFAEVTQQLVTNPSPTNQFAIVLDGVVVSAPVVQSAIVDGNAQITGNFTQQEATDLANVLKYGALPLAFDAGEVQSISAALGSNQLKAGILAGLLGLLLVVVYSLLYYRGLGLVITVSLVLAAALTYGLLVLLGHTIGYTLTLAGIAGAIVAIGITADSFVVFFERIRDEMRDGRSMKVAVETGWRRARRTILAADAVSLIAAIVLYVLSVGGVRGFAFTLGLTTILDVFIVFFFTKPIMTVLARTKFFGNGHPLSGLDPRRLGVRPPTPRRATSKPAAEEA